MGSIFVATLVCEAGERKPTRLLVATLVWEPRAGGGGGGGEGRRPPFFQITTRNEQGTRQPNRHNSKCRTRPDGRPGSKEEPRLRKGRHGKTPRRRKTARNNAVLSLVSRLIHRYGSYKANRSIRLSKGDQLTNKLQYVSSLS